MKTISTNRKAFFDYDITDRIVAGIVLAGGEIKSIRKGELSIQESFCYIDDQNRLIIRNMYITKYEKPGQTLSELSENRDRFLLVNKSELKKLTKSSQEKGHTIIPLKVLLSKGKAKVEIGIAVGKKKYDKRQAIKERDIKRDLKRQGLD